MTMFLLALLGCPQPDDPFGTDKPAVGLADEDGDGFDEESDCDDQNGDVFPNAVERCNGIDDDCDGGVDNTPLDGVKSYADVDGDTYGNSDAALVVCEGTAGYAEVGGDCNDADATVFPGAMEICDGVDQNCNGEIDDNPDDGDDFWADADGDTYGDPFTMVSSCTPLEGYVERTGDCDDTRADVHDDAAEYCGGVDYDCDGAISEDNSVDAPPYYEDLDRDGYAGTLAGYACTVLEGYAETADDCDDADATVHPDAADPCDEIDNDCDGDVDGGLRVPADHATIQAAIDVALTGETVCVAAGTYAENLVISLAPITLEGAGSGATVVDAGGLGRAMEVGADASESTIRGFTFSGGEAEAGAGLYCDGPTITLSDVELTANSCTLSETCTGVGLYLSGDSTLENVQLTDNYAAPVAAGASDVSAMGVGGAMFNAFTEVSSLEVSGNEAWLDGLSDVGNTATAYGVGLALVDASGELADVAITDNYVAMDNASFGVGEAYGVGLWSSADFLATDGVTATGNSAELGASDSTAAGGGLFLLGSYGTWLHVDLRENAVSATTAWGGGAATEEGAPALENVIAAGNTATAVSAAAGGGIYVSGGSPELWQLTIVGNTASGETAAGGGLVVTNSASVVATNTVVSGNTAAGTLSASGGAVWLGDGGVSFLYSAFYGNSSESFAGMTSPVGTDGNVEVDPTYVDVTSASASAWDVRLAGGSPLVDAGDPSALDADGTVSDVGAYGGPEGAW